MKIVFTLIPAFLLLILSSCSQGPASEVPPLYEPVTAHLDTAIVARGTVAQLSVMTAVTRNYTEAVRLTGGSGRLGNVYAWPGDTVYEGQILASMDTERLLEQIETQDENLRRMDNLHRISIEQMHINVELLEISLNEANLNLGSNPTEANLNRINDLNESLNWARLDIEHARNRHNTIRNETVTNLERLRNSLGYTEIRAPFDGEIVFSSALPGSWLNRLDPVMYIARPGEIFFEYIDGNVIHGGARLAARFTTIINGEEHELELMPSSVEENLYYSNRNLAPPLRFVFKYAGVDVPPGTQTFIRHYRIYETDVLRIPRNALFAGGGHGTYVYRIENGVQVLVPVLVGARTDSFISIREGLYEGDEVFVRQ